MFTKIGVKSKRMDVILSSNVYEELSKAKVLKAERMDVII